MGFRLDRTYTLEFEGDMAGAEVKLRSTSVATVMRIRSLSDPEELAGLLAEHVIAWNLDDKKGAPLPVTVEAILGDLEEVVLAAIVREWYKAATGATAPLDASTTAEAMALEETLAGV